ncbi:UDP-3-O-acyl-N-acetylglucosamine deacetylase [Alsobacter metallidurans]|uniref:UDP-3-O-acyl-N-acetylglucosamine deacetylase n=1 Tax=Alsobacter metallidurans TaxID=340221 RepID=A0A917ML32_9HYPH|nr:UDP-3-O-acyl-N-acetylglucosamine deacetylase [Alsobacter metallidurans]GGH27423.1 UDP-3-O-acyl-N-acetylglucosamine deacetylase [Alsobacter metallidurans]
MAGQKQTTLRDRVELQGIGVHSGAPVRIVLHPADVDSGISFLRTRLDGGRERLIQARHSAVSATELCTIIGETASGAVATIEHLMAALSGLGVDNVLVEIDGPEVPIMDGSAAPFVDAIDQVGLERQGSGRRYIKILKPVRVEQGRAFSELRPFARGFRLEVEIDFDTQLIGRQKRVLDLEPGVFRRDIARARTFGFMKDVERLWKAGFALGASLDNTVALGDEGVINPEGLRFADEFVRHKTLDAVGDLSLAGSPILGCYRSYCGGHRMNVAVLQALFADRSNYAIVENGRRETGHAESAARPALAFAAETN